MSTCRFIDNCNVEVRPHNSKIPRINKFQPHDKRFCRPSNRWIISNNNRYFYLHRISRKDKIFHHFRVIKRNIIYPFHCFRKATYLTRPRSYFDLAIHTFGKPGRPYFKIKGITLLCRLDCKRTLIIKIVSTITRNHTCSQSCPVIIGKIYIIVLQRKYINFLSCTSCPHQSDY